MLIFARSNYALFLCCNTIITCSNPLQVQHVAFQLLNLNFPSVSSGSVHVKLASVGGFPQKAFH